MVPKIMVVTALFFLRILLVPASPRCHLLGLLEISYDPKWGHPGKPRRRVIKDILQCPCEFAMMPLGTMAYSLETC